MKKILDDFNETVQLFLFRLLYNLFLGWSKLSSARIQVDNIEDSLKFIRDNRVSIGRFGDGEFKWIFKQKALNKFEENSDELSNALLKVIASKRTDFKICIPDVFRGLEKYTPEAEKFWAKVVGHHGYQWLKILNNNYTYLDSLITRPYIIYKNRKKSKQFFDFYKSIWKDKDILLVEGSKTRFGIGDDLLSTSKSVNRIICPPTGSFRRYNEIYLKVANYVNKTPNKKNLLLLISLGPTATVLAYDISLMDVQALDIGHLDIEYDWFLENAQDKKKIKYKYVNEVGGGDQVQPLPMHLNKLYKSQIVNKIE